MARLHGRKAARLEQPEGLSSRPGSLSKITDSVFGGHLALFCAGDIASCTVRRAQDCPCPDSCISLLLKVNCIGNYALSPAPEVRLPGRRFIEQLLIE